MAGQLACRQDPDEGLDKLGLPSLQGSLYIYIYTHIYIYIHTHVCVCVCVCIMQQLDGLRMRVTRLFGIPRCGKFS